MDLNSAIADAIAAVPMPSAEPEAPQATDDAATLDATAVEAPAETDGETSDDPAIAEAVASAKNATATTPDAEEGAEEPAAPDEDTLALPDGYTAPAVLTDGLATEFTMLDADGEIEIPNVTVKFKANGKMREERLDQVVKLAQVGVYNVEREERLKSIEPERDQYKALVEEREAQLERAITDPAFLAALQEAYAKETSPEAELQRTKAEVRDLRVQQQLEKIQEVGQQFYETEVSPALEMITKAAPTITVDELEEKFAMAMAAHAEEAPNGQPYVPPSRYEAVRQYIIDDLAVWAMAHHERRSKQASPAVPASAPKPVAPAKTDPNLVAAQQAKREVGKITKPVGVAAKDSGAPAKSAPPATLDDAVTSALDSVLTSFR